MLLWGKSFKDVGNIFKTSWSKSWEDFYNSFDGFDKKLDVTSGKIKTFGGAIGSGLKDVFTKTKDSPFELLSKTDAEKIISKNAKAYDAGAVSMQKFNASFNDKGIKAYLATVDAGSATFKGYSEFITQSNTALKATSLSSKAAAVGMKALSMAMNMALMAGAVWVLQEVVSQLGHLINAQAEASEAAYELAEKTKQSAREDKEKVKSIDELITKYKELKSAGSLNTESTKEVYSIQDKITELVGTQASNLDLVNGKLDEEIAKLKTISLQQAEQAKESAKAAYNAAVESNKAVTGSESFAFTKGYIYSGEHDKAAEEALKSIQGLYTGSAGLGFEQNTVINFMNSMEDTTVKLEILNQAIDVLKKNGLTDSPIYTSFVTFRDEVNKTFDEVQSANNGMIESIANLAQIKVSNSGLTVDSVDSFERYRQAVIDVTMSDELFSGSVEDAKSQVDRLLSTMPQFNQYFAETANQTGILSFALDDISNELTSFNDEISKLYGQFDIVNSAISEFNEYGAISVATFKNLSDNNLLQYLEFTANGLQVNTEKLLQNEQALKEQALSTLKAALGEDLLALATKEASDEAVTAQTSIAGAGNNAETAAQKFANAAIGAADLAVALAAVNAVASGQELDLSGKQDQAKALIDQYQKTAAAIDSIKFSTNSATNAFGGFSTAANSAASSVKNAANEMKQAMSSAQSAIQSLLSMTMNMIKQQYNDQKKSIQSQLDALNKRYNAEKDHLDNIAKEKKKQYDAEKKALQDELDGYRKRINAQLELLRAKEEERDYQNELSEKQKDVADLEADLATSSLDTSEEGVRRRLELESQLSDKRKELDEFQHDKSIEDQENALNKQLSNFEDQINSKLDLLEMESQRYEEMHQERLDDIDGEYERKRERLEAQQKNIEEKVSNEALIRAEAIKLIEGKSDDFYKQLLNYNRTYGDSLDATVITTWNNAYTSLEKFNGGQLSVLGVLNDLAIKMNDFQLATKSAAEEMQDLANAIKYKNQVESQSKPANSTNSNNSSKQYGGGGRGFKTGGMITKDRALATNIDNEPDAVLIKAHTGEVVLPKDNPRRTLDLMAEFINSDKPLSNYINREFSNEAMSAVQFQTSAMGIGSSNLQNYERISNYGGDTKIENTFHIQGNMDKSIIPEVERMINRKFHENAKRQVNALTSRGGGLNAAKRGF